MNGFRAWDVKEKLWIPEELVAIDGDGKIYTRENEYEDWMEEVIPITIVRPTGLEDMSRRSIDEYTALCYEDTVCIVKWSNELACFIVILPDGSDEFLNRIHDKAYIMSSIFDRPELMTPTQRERVMGTKNFNEILSKIPEAVKKEIEPYGIKITGYGSRRNKLISISTDYFPLEGNKKMIEDLLSKGWIRKHGCTSNSKRYLRMTKNLI